MPTADGCSTELLFVTDNSGIGIAGAAASSCESVAFRTASDAAGDVLLCYYRVWRVCIRVVMGLAASGYVIVKRVEVPLD